MNFYLTALCARFSKRAVYLTVIVLLTGFLFFSCGEEEPFVDDGKLNSRLIGTWTSEFTDGYIITTNDISYDFGGGYIGYAGTIEYVTNFSKTAGVIIIKYKAGQEQTYPIYNEVWEIVGYNDRPGDYVGIYYENFKPGVSVDMGTAINLVDYTGAEEKTLDEAKAAFTAGKRGDYIGLMGVYLKQ
ncbi:MAG: hypothetical protein LBG94_03215 [Treponema sp.]|jgi:hypothetical protein|nr:hypothetical protein [Treponema sp.]